MDCPVQCCPRCENKLYPVYHLCPGISDVGRDSSLTRDRRQQKWADSPFVAAWYQTSVTISPEAQEIPSICANKYMAKGWGKDDSHSRVRPCPSHSSESSRWRPVLGLTGQTAMQGASGKPQGTMARVHLGHVSMVLCTRL